MIGCNLLVVRTLNFNFVGGTCKTFVQNNYGEKILFCFGATLARIQKRECHSIKESLSIKMEPSTSVPHMETSLASYHGFPFVTGSSFNANNITGLLKFPDREQSLFENKPFLESKSSSKQISEQNKITPINRGKWERKADFPRKRYFK